AFDRCYFAGADHTKQISVINVDGGAGSGLGAVEAPLDIEDVAAYAPAAHIDVYEAPSTLTGWLDEFAVIVGQDRASVVSASYGLCEAQIEEAAPGLQQTENILFEEAALQGQSILASSGDSGSETCFRNDATDTSLSVSDPAAQPFVTAVGGTTLESVTNPPAERTWNDGGSAQGYTAGASGGGISKTWEMPAWQSGLSVPGLRSSYSSGAPCGAPSGQLCREVPDVSASADELHGDTVYVGGGWTTVGGTSAASPKWAAALTVTDSYCAGVGRGPVGFANPVLYTIAANPLGAAEAFNDITEGNNDDLGIHHGAYPATVGYDMATGLGSPRLTGLGGSPGLAALLCAHGTSDPSRPIVSGIAPSFGSVAGGTSVSIHGSGLAGITSVQFGPASVAVRSSEINGAGTEITIDTPRSPVQAWSSDTPVGGVLVVVAGPRGASQPRTSVVFHYIAGSSASPVPSVFYVTPTSGAVSGGSTVTIYGSGFGVGLSHGAHPVVDVGSVAASQVKVISDTELRVVVPTFATSTVCATESDGVPRASLCQAQVTVSNVHGTSATAPILPPPTGSVDLEAIFPPPGNELVPSATEYDYTPVPTLSSISPPVFSLTGLNSFGDPFATYAITVTGTGFNALTAEDVLVSVPGDAKADVLLPVIAITPTTMEVLNFGLPLEVAPRDVQVSVVTSAGTSAPLTEPVAPTSVTVTGISVHDGSTAGGTVVLVTGSGFKDMVGAAFIGEGGSSSNPTTQDLVVLTSARLRFVAPASTVGRGFFEVCNVSVCAGDPTTAPFTYYDPVPPLVTGISPTVGPAGGGPTILITGSGLGSVQRVLFGTVASPRASDLSTFLGPSDTAVKATIPPGIPGSVVGITVETLAGTSPVAPARFRYVRSAPAAPSAVTARVLDGIVHVSWSAPSVDGGSPVTGYLVSATSVHFALLHVEPKIQVGPSARSASLYVPPGITFKISVASENALGSSSANAASTVELQVSDDGYLVAAQDGTVLRYGDLQYAPPGIGGLRNGPVIVGIAAAYDSDGYWLAASDGQVFSVGDALALGSLPAGVTKAPVVAIAAIPDSRGYWLVTSTGRVFTFGGAKFYGSLAGQHLSSPIVGIARTLDGSGYWLASANGKVYPFGDARKFGSLAGRTGRIVAIASDPAGTGYWLVSSTGGVFSFGAKFEGSFGKHPPTSPVVGAVATPDGLGYWVLESDGAIRSFGDARYVGDAVGATVVGRLIAIAV
ncbi:MAG TPA: IPT/TIG domain-containing protein, partial [Acidimicrobiales bacterium]|nr:IPT/TIG domain-containing protein [Acidimicrobiales bacterium]